MFKNFFFNIFNIICSNLILFRKNNDRTILLDTENNINLAEKYRSDLFYIKKNSKILILNKKPLNNSSNKNLEFIDNKKFFFLKRNKNIQYKLNQVFDILLHDVEINYNYKGFLHHIKNIKYLTSKIHPIFFYYNIKYFVTTTSTNILSESVGLLRKFIQFESISYQYSYLRKANPIMSTNVNHMLIFSDYFNKIFFNSFGRPKNIYSTGYLYSSLNEKYKKHIKFYKKKFNLKNKFVIGYFDENCEDNNWSLTTIDDMQKNYNTLAKFVLTNPEFCVLVKTQFLKNIPSILLYENKCIEKAIKSGRFIEFNHLTTKDILKKKLYFKNLSNRNLIMPMMVALLTDITISEKYGATTSLETAIIGKRNIFINEKRYKTTSDKLFKKNIEFLNLENALKRILIFKKNKYIKKFDNLGNWKDIINHYLKINKYSSFQKKINEILSNTYNGNNINNR